MLWRLPAGSRLPIYLTATPSSIRLIEPRTDDRDASPPPPPRPPLPAAADASCETLLLLDMPRPPVKKPDNPKMDSRRPPSFRPKSRTESSGEGRWSGKWWEVESRVGSLNHSDLSIDNY
ncbi:hypothetical protein JTB14_009975 [Gonioctena quinquepunctata]|nr:hypothetical protein JTB14_009975 [Gonioctena quinquepunctata]